MTLTVSIVLGSVRPGRQGIRVGKYLQSKFVAAGLKVHLIDPVEVNLPVFINRFAYLPEDKKTDEIKALQAKFEESDAFVVVSPEYNHTYSPVIANLLDYFGAEYAQKVAGIVTYSVGSFGGVRAAGPLRPFFGELGLVTIPKELPFPVVQNLLNEDGTLQATAGPSGESVENGTDVFVKQIKWYGEALKNARAAGAQ